MPDDDEQQQNSNGNGNSSPRKALSLSYHRGVRSDRLAVDDVTTSLNSSAEGFLRRMESAPAEGSELSQIIQRRASLRYDVSHAMDRLRSTFIADADPPQDGSRSVPFTITALSDDDDDDDDDGDDDDIDSPAPHVRRTLRNGQLPLSEKDLLRNGKRSRGRGGLAQLQSALKQIPAIVLIAMFHLMIGIPFGVSYFPVGWRNDIALQDMGNNATDGGGGDASSVHGPFPLPGKEALGIRMFLFSTIIGQVVFTLTSNFNNPIGLQMVENVPFCHELAVIVIRHQGYGMESLATLFVMFGLASVVVGGMFYYLGRYELGRIIYYFPNHVLVGCIGGIGVYIALTGIEVTMDAAFSGAHFIDHWNLLQVTFAFEILLRILERVTLDANGKPRYTLLSPIYFCSITPIFYVGLWVLGYPAQQARDEGYFFPSISTANAVTNGDDSTTSWLDNIFQDEGMFDMFKVLDFTAVSWRAIFDAIPTLVALTLFSLIHVPINIPAFAISTNTDVDMNNELKSHGYSNMIAGLCGGGLQNYMAYTQSVVYDRSGGRGKRSGIAVAVVTALLFFIGPTVASFIPRCMAGALLLHVGIDLFLEGVYDSYRKFDTLEYVGIWVIVVCMTLYGMEAAMIAGVIAAVSTYAVQSIAYLSPIRGSMSAVTLRSSHRNRSFKAAAVLDDPVNGRSRIVVIQLQGHLFFGNMAQLNAGIDNLLKNIHPPDVSKRRRIVIMDCSLVLGIDSSAAQGLIKLKNTMHKKHHVDICVWVSGSDVGFPCEYDLSTELTSVPEHPHNRSNDMKAGENRSKPKTAKDDPEVVNEASSLLHGAATEEALTPEEEQQYLMDFYGSYVLESLDLALIFAENALIAWEDPKLLDDYELGTPGGEHLRWDFRGKARAPSSLITNAVLSPSRSSLILSGDEDEREIALRMLMNIRVDRGVDKQDVEVLFSKLQREFYSKDEFIWRQSDASDSAKLVVSGMLLAFLENEAGTSEVVFSGNLIGELGLVQGSARLSSVQCICDEGAVLYSLSRESYEDLLRENPKVARFIDVVCIQYLANRVQHVSNRIFETRCLPI